MIFTKELLEKGKSSGGGWNNKQLSALGITDCSKGWKFRIIGKDIPEKNIALFLELKDAHFKTKIENGKNVKKKVLAKMGIIDFEPILAPIPFKEQYQHPNWQRMRMFVLNRDKYTCVNCKARDKTLHAHHLKYKPDCYVWNVPHWYIVTLCEDCHSLEHNKDLTIKK